MASTNNSSCFAWISAWMILRSSCRISGRRQSCSDKFILPLSMRLISRTSLIKLNRWFPEVIIFRRYPSTCSLCSRWLRASVVKPMIAFIGVRISCDILERNVLFARFARFACKRASSSVFFFSISLRVSSSMLRNPTTTPRLVFHSPARTAFI